MTTIIQVTRNFPPLWGGMERLNWHLADQLTHCADVKLIAPQGAARKAPKAIETREVPLRPLAQFLLNAGVRTWQMARTCRPKWIIAGSGLTAPLAFAAAKGVDARTAAYVHGLDLTARHPVYRALWLPAIRRMDRIIANSRPTAQLVENLGVPADKITIVHPGVELPQADAAQRRTMDRDFRMELDLGDRPLLLSVGRLTRRKGLSVFVREVLPSIVQARPEVCLLIIGDAPRNSLAAQVETPEMILATAEAAGVKDNVRWLGLRFGKALSAAFFAADLHVFPVRHLPNDPEGFGMVAIEAAAHGLPTVAYATGGIVDAVADGISGRLVPADDGAGFAQAVLDHLSDPLDSQRVRDFASRFAWPKFGQAVSKAILPR